MPTLITHLITVQSTKYQPLPGSIIGENNDRELVRDFQVYTEQAMRLIRVFKLKIEKMQEVNNQILQPIVGA